MVENMTSYDSIMSYYYSIKNKNIFNVLMKYRKKFRNYLHVITMHLKKKYPIIAHLKNGQTISVANSNHLYSILTDLNYNQMDDSVTIEYDSRNLKIYQGIDNGDIVGIFHNDCYGFLPVENNTVIDIGANIADSSIYFACRKAKKVIAIEPYLGNYAVAKKNIETNYLSDTIDLMLAACSNHSGSMSLDGHDSNVYRSTEAGNNGADISLVTLPDIISKYKIDSAIIKMDCEGAEYPILLGTDDDILNRFTHIQIEYHYGYANLCKRLEKCGFSVAISRPIYHFNKYVTNKKMYVGWIFANKNIP